MHVIELRTASGIPKKISTLKREQGMRLSTLLIREVAYFNGRKIISQIPQINRPPSRVQLLVEELEYLETLDQVNKTCDRYQSSDRKTES